jgi:hypothetical protein
MTVRPSWVANIPTPYRNHRHERMSEGFPRLGMEFEVQFMAWSEPVRLETFKGLHLFLPLFEGQTRVLLLVCGEGSFRGELQEMIEARSLPVRLVGQKSEAEMVLLYAAATPLESLLSMGARSRELYHRRFDSDACIRRVGEGIPEPQRRHSGSR